MNTPTRPLDLDDLSLITETRTLHVWNDAHLIDRARLLERLKLLHLEPTESGQEYDLLPTYNALILSNLINLENI